MPLIANNAPLKPTTAYTIELTNLVQGLVSDEKKVAFSESLPSSSLITSKFSEFSSSL